MTEDGLDLALRGIVVAFVEQCREELDQRWREWKIDLSEAEVYEVVGSHLARQLTLARELAENPSLWTPHIAPLILRSMADVFISLAWILEEPLDRSKKFVLYGLGQAKLRLEHRKEAMKGRDSSPEELAAVQAHEDWINQQRFTFLTEVNVGSWSGISVREMARVAGCLDFYNLVYNPFSACTHSMWQHLAVYNLIPCMNPLHRYHSVPCDRDLPMDSHYLYLAGKYWQKTISLFDSKFPLDVGNPVAYERICDELERLSQKEPASGNQRDGDQDEKATDS